MMMSEFIDRTGFEPTASEYAEIEEAYYNFDGDKDQFCKSWLKDGGIKKTAAARAKQIARLEGQIVELEKMFKADAEAQEKRISDLQAQLDKELEWKPCNSCGTNMSQERYEDLLRSCTGQNGDPHIMGEDEAKRLVAEEFGFVQDKVEIITTVHTYEVNRHNLARKAAAYDRQPLYFATDWNYVRFNVHAVGTFFYEMVNGDLRVYCC